MFEEVKVIFMDVDGVLTAGEVYTGSGESPRIMHVRDRLVIKALKEKSSEDIKIYWITARSSEHLKDTGKQLKVDGVYTGIEDKLAVVKEILSQTGLSASSSMYIGDDLVDLACMKFVSFSCAPGDAADEVKKSADFVSAFPGGKGAIREIIEKILQDRQKWKEVVRKFEKIS